MLQRPELWRDLFFAFGVLFVFVMVFRHFKYRSAGVEERIEEEAAQPELPPLLPLKTAAEKAEVAEKTQWLATVARTAHVHRDEGEQLQAGPLLCDRPALPPYGSEAWLSIRLAAMKHRPVSWRRLDAAIAPEWVAEISARAKAMEPTQEIAPETLAKVLGGLR